MSERMKEIRKKDCSSMVSIAAFGPEDPGSNQGLFAVLNSNRKLSF